MQNMSQMDWMHLVKSTIARHVFLKLKSESAINKKTNYFEFVLFKPAAYLFDVDPQFVCAIFRCVPGFLISK